MNDKTESKIKASLRGFRADLMGFLASAFPRTNQRVKTNFFYFKIRVIDLQLALCGICKISL